MESIGLQAPGEHSSEWITNDLADWKITDLETAEAIEPTIMKVPDMPLEAVENLDASTEGKTSNVSRKTPNGFRFKATEETLTSLQRLIEASIVKSNLENANYKPSTPPVRPAQQFSADSMYENYPERTFFEYNSSMKNMICFLIAILIMVLIIIIIIAISFYAAGK